MNWFLELELAGLVVILVVLEIALCIDNLKSVSNVFHRFDASCRIALEQLSLWIGLFLRIAVLTAIVSVLPLVDAYMHGTVFGTARHLLLTIGGIYLILCGFFEIKSHFKIPDQAKKKERSWSSKPTVLLLQVLIVDLILSVDSIVVAVSVSGNLVLLITSMVIAQVILCLIGSKLERFFAERKTLMTVIMAFIVLIGVVSVVRGLGVVLAEECLMAALLFGLIVEWLNHRHLRASEVRNLEESRPSLFNSLFLEQPRRRQKEYVFTESNTTEPVRAAEQDCPGCARSVEPYFSFCLGCGESFSKDEVWLGSEPYRFCNLSH